MAAHYVSALSNIQLLLAIIVQCNLDLTNLYINKALGIFQPTNSVMYGKGPRYNEPISPWLFVKPKCHCTIPHKTVELLRNTGEL